MVGVMEPATVLLIEWVLDHVAQEILPTDRSLRHNPSEVEVAVDDHPNENCEMDQATSNHHCLVHLPKLDTSQVEDVGQKRDVPFHAHKNTEQSEDCKA